MHQPLQDAADPFETALTVFTQRDIASYLGVDVRTIARWRVEGLSSRPETYASLEALVSRFGKSHVENRSEFEFIDLFAGIGGIRQGFEAEGGQCIFTSEWNKFSQKTYLANFGAGHTFVGDITQARESVPVHDVLLAGFPCQPFSIAGVSKKNSLKRPHGFDDPTQGTLFFEIKKILQERRPAAFLLENVKNLASHDGGKTFGIIMATLRDELGYEVHTKVVDGAHFTPQHRERILIAGFARPTNFQWDEMVLPSKLSRMRDVLHRTDGSEPYVPSDGVRYFDHQKRAVNDHYTLTPRLWEYLQGYAKKHRSAGNGFGFGLVGPDSVSRTLSARYYKDGSEILVDQSPQRPRRLTPRECARLMGYPDSFVIPVSDSQAYRQFGNSVVVPVFRAAALAMKPHILGVKRQLAVGDEEYLTA